ncbi:MAG: DUF2520 domain-containing protein [Saprospiraceae bacterium]
MWQGRSIVLIGAGHVAVHLGKHLHQCGAHVAAVWSRQPENAMELAASIGCPAVTDWASLPTAADLYVMAVPDNAIDTVAAALQAVLPPTAWVVHTSGATPSEVLSPYFQRYGVFYPLQTFTRQRDIDFAQVPLCVLSNREEDEAVLLQLAKETVLHAHKVSDEQRAWLHVAAVFVNNFTNHLQYIAHELVDAKQLPGEILQPLLRETIAKLETLTPTEAQTGPAIRGDSTTIDRHLAMLAPFPRYQEVYELLTNGIVETKK